MDDEGSNLPARGDRRDKHYSADDVEMDEIWARAVTKLPEESNLIY